MKRNITNLELYNYTRDNVLIGNVREGRHNPLYGEIIDIAELGIIENEIYWKEDLDGETRTFVSSQIRATTYNVIVLDSYYDKSSKTGDIIYLKMTRAGITFYLYGVLSKIGRDRFVINDNYKYRTEYEMYIGNPLWMIDQIEPPSEYEPDNMVLIANVELPLYEQISSKTFTVNKNWLNTQRGIKLEMVMATAQTGDFEAGKTIKLQIDGNEMDIKSLYADWDIGTTLYMIMGKSVFASNIALTSGGQWDCNLMEDYGDYSVFYINPPLWDDHDTITILQTNDCNVDDLTLTINIYMIKGWYF